MAFVKPIHKLQRKNHIKLAIFHKIPQKGIKFYRKYFVFG